MAEDTKTKPTPQIGEVSAPKKIEVAKGFWGFFSATLQNMPVATPEFFERHAGKNFWDIAEEMTHDPHIQSVFRSRRAGVAGRNWEIVAGEDSTKGQEVAERIKSILASVPNFEHTLAHLLKAIPYGHSVIEILWRIEADRIGVEALRTRRADRFTLGSQNTLQLLNPDTGQPQGLPDRKFICHRHDPQDDAPFASPLLFSLYWAWYFKKHAHGFWMIIAEKFGVPTIIGKYPAHFTDEDISALIKALVNLQQDSVAAVPVDTQIDTQLAKVSVGEKGNFFRELLDFCNAEISKAVLGGTLTQEVGEKGSYAAAQTHLEVRHEIIASDARLLQTTINSTLLRWLTDFNYGPDVPAPLFRIDYKLTRGTPEFAATLKTLADMGVQIPERFVHEAFGIPEPEEDEEILQAQGGGGIPFEEHSPFPKPPDAS